MPDKLLANVAASVRTRLLNAAKASGQPYDILLIRYVLERLLYRLSQSPHADRFVLKGAMLLTEAPPPVSNEWPRTRLRISGGISRRSLVIAEAPERRRS